MALKRTQIERFEYSFKDDEELWKDKSHSRKFYKKQMNKYMRKKKFNEDSYKRDKKQYRDWEY